MKKNIIFVILLTVFLFSNCLLAMTEIPKETMEALTENTTARDFVLEDLNTNQIALSSFKDKKSVVLFFWATWCPYCRRAIQSLEKEYPALKMKNIEVLSINLGESKPRIARFLKQYPVSFSVLLDADMTVSDTYEVVGVPTYILIDTKGTIRYRGHRLPKDYAELVK